MTVRAVSPALIVSIKSSGSLYLHRLPVLVRHIDSSCHHAMAKSISLQSLQHLSDIAGSESSTHRCVSMTLFLCISHLY